MPSPKRSLARALTLSLRTQTNRNTKAEGKPLLPDPLKNSRSPSKSCGTSRRGRGWGDPGARPVAHAPERLLRNGFLQEVIKGWYIPSRPDEVKRESTAWYASFWRSAQRIWKRVSARAGAFHRNNHFRFMPATGRAQPARGAVAARGQQGHQNSRMARPCWSFASRCRCGGAEGRGRPAAVLGESALIACSPIIFRTTRRMSARCCR